MRLASKKSRFIDSEAEASGEDSNDYTGNDSDEGSMGGFIVADSGDENSGGDESEAATSDGKRKRSTEQPPSRLKDMPKKKQKRAQNKNRVGHLYEQELGTADTTNLPPIYFTTKLGDKDLSIRCRRIYTKGSINHCTGDVCGRFTGPLTNLGALAPLCFHCFKTLAGFPKKECNERLTNKEEQVEIRAKFATFVKKWKDYKAMPKTGVVQSTKELPDAFRSLLDAIAE